MQDRQLSPHFTLHELLRSATAERIPALRAAQFNPPPAVVANLETLVAHTLEPLRLSLGQPLHVTSGYRCPAVNRRVGGARTSQHLHGQAADLHLLLDATGAQHLCAEIAAALRPHTARPLRPDVAPDFLLFAWIALRCEELAVDQLIHEFGEGPGRPAWVHVSSSPRGRRQILLIDPQGTHPLDLPEALALGT